MVLMFLHGVFPCWAFQDDGSIIGSPKLLLQHLFTSTTANFITSSSRSNQAEEAKPIRLPTTFFLNADGFRSPVLGLELKAPKFMVPYQEVYVPTIKK